jgi:hypothetical protein
MNSQKLEVLDTVPQDQCTKNPCTDREGLIMHMHICSHTCISAYTCGHTHIIIHIQMQINTCIHRYISIWVYINMHAHGQKYASK